MSHAWDARDWHEDWPCDPGLRDQGDRTQTIGGGGDQAGLTSILANRGDRVGRREADQTICRVGDHRVRGQGYHGVRGQGRLGVGGQNGATSYRVKQIGPVADIGVGKFQFLESAGQRELINRALLKIKENGAYDRIYQKWFGKN